MAQIVTVEHVESVALDPARLGELYAQLGEAGAEDVVGRASEELGVRLAHCEQLWRRGDMAGLRKSARSLIAIADQVGMRGMAAIARDVMQAVDAGDQAAAAAVLFRLLRVGEGSLSAVWDQRGARI